MKAIIFMGLVLTAEDWRQVNQTLNVNLPEGIRVGSLTRFSFRQQGAERLGIGQVMTILADGRGGVRHWSLTETEILSVEERVKQQLAQILNAQVAVHLHAVMVDGDG